MLANRTARFRLQRARTGVQTCGMGHVLDMVSLQWQTEASLLFSWNE